MMPKRTWPTWLQLVGIMNLGLAMIVFLTISLAFGQEKKTKYAMDWKLGNGQKITQNDLVNILSLHNIWVENIKIEALVGEKNVKKTEKGRMANLNGANLSSANLSKTNLIWASLVGTNLGSSNLSGAYLFMANMRKANLRGANLSGAKLGWARLDGAILVATNLVGALLSGANLSGAIFEPDPGLPGIIDLRGIEGLSTITYESSPHGLMELREVFKKGGMRKEEREVTYALNHNRREKLWKDGGLPNKIESLFYLVMFELTCDYGMSPGRSLRIIGIAIILFSLTYMMALRSRNRETGIWVVLMPDRVLAQRIKHFPYKLTTRIPCHSLPWGWRVLRVLRLGFYFSLLSAFSLGWREINVGNWISRIQKREYTLRATGWVRTIAGIQSLLSVYMLALWALTYFGRPFD